MTIKSRWAPAERALGQRTTVRTRRKVWVVATATPLGGAAVASFVLALSFNGNRGTQSGEAVRTPAEFNPATIDLGPGRPRRRARGARRTPGPWDRRWPR